LKHDFKEEAYDLFFFYWSGHGVIEHGRKRHLFFANATGENKVNLDLDELLFFLKTDYFKKGMLSRQILFLDACADFVEKLNLKMKLPSITFAQGKPLENREQFVLMAAKPGEKAKNLDLEKRSLFTKHLMTELGKQNECPPDMEKTATNLKQLFEELCKNDKTVNQTPTTFIIKSWKSDEEIITHKKADSANMVDYEEKLSERENKIQLVELLLKCPSMQTPEGREDIQGELPNNIRNAIPRRSANNADVRRIVDTCLNYNNGISKLINILGLELFDGETKAFKKLQEWLDAL
jgi:hypothetical protein